MAEPEAQVTYTNSTSSHTTVWWTATTTTNTDTSTLPGVNITSTAINTASLTTPASGTVSPTLSGTYTETYTATFTGAATSVPTALNGTALLTSPQTSNPSGKFNTGTLAGAIVGSFVGGCLLAFLAAFLFFRRKRPQSGDSGAWAAADKSAAAKSVDGVSSYAATPVPGKSLVPTAVAVGAASLDLSSYVTQPAEDSAVCMRVQVLLDQVGLHIDNYYSRTTSNPPLTSDNVDRIGGFDSSSLPASITTMLSTPKAQRPVLIHILAQSALQAINPGSHGLSLLPACYALAPQRQRVDSVDTNTTQALFAWRMLTTHLNARSQTPVPPTESITEFAENFTKAFTPYSSAQFTETDRLRHLQSVGKAAADLGIWLFSQPCSFEFRWNGGGFSPDDIVTNPAIVKVADEYGQRLAVPLTLAEETTVRI